MHAPSRNDQFVRNGILGSLCRGDFDYLRPLLQSVTLKQGSVLQEPSRQVEYVHFVETGLVSLMTLAVGNILGTAIVSSRGFDPVSVALGAMTSAHRSIVLIQGTAFRIGVDDLQRALQERPQIHEHLLRYVHSVMVQCSQTAFCGLQHHLDQRLACWLSLVCAATEDNVLPITHSHLSMILGFRRVAVTLALTQFEREGLVRKTRGMLQVRNRELLQKKACGCYEVVVSSYKRKTQPRDLDMTSRIRFVVDGQS